MNATDPQEDISGKAYDLALALRLWQFIRPHRKVFFLSLLLLPVHQLFNLVQPLLIKAAFDAVGAGDGFTLHDHRRCSSPSGACWRKPGRSSSSTTWPCWWRNGAWPICASRFSPTCSGCP